MSLDWRYECDYCGKRYKKDHDKCPSCGHYYLKLSEPLMKEAHPRLYAELSYSGKNYVDDKEYSDDRVSETEELSWECPKCGELWTATISERLKGLKAPCMRKRTIIHFDGDIEEKPSGTVLCKLNTLDGVLIMTTNQLVRAVERKEIPIYNIDKTNHGLHTHYYVGARHRQKSKPKEPLGFSAWDDDL